jgi:hypothetical protein
MSHAHLSQDERYQIQWLDELLTNICEAIDLPLFQVPAKRAYSAQELQTQFASVVGVASAVAAVAI